MGAPVPLYLPSAWTSDRGRCRAASVPDNVDLATKPVLVRRVVERALAVGVPFGRVPADAVYGGAGRLRLRLASCDLVRHPLHLPFGRPAQGARRGMLVGGPRAAGGLRRTVPSCRPGPAPLPRRVSAAQVTGVPGGHGDRIGERGPVPGAARRTGRRRGAGAACGHGAGEAGPDTTGQEVYT
ncbi:transposase [Streptomyces canarius]